MGGVDLLFSRTQTEKGSALHEAALFGKMDVVQLLLDSGMSFRCVCVCVYWIIYILHVCLYSVTDL